MCRSIIFTRVNRQAGSWKWNSSAFIVTVADLYKKDLFADVSFTHGRRFDDEVSNYRLFLRSKKIVFINGNF